MKGVPWTPRFDPAAQANQPFDLIVVGGGIHGCGVARDAARRGLRVALFEKGDIGSGTSSASSKLVHGGLRYLEQLRFGLVRESLRERRTLLHIAPHLVRPLPFLLPLYEDAPHGRFKLRAGLSIYDFLAGRSRLERHGWLDAEAALELEPSLQAEELRGAFHYADAQMNDARLCLENAMDAVEHGAQVWNYTRVDALVREGDRVAGVRVGSTELRARLVVLAVGPWHGLLDDAGRKARPTKLRLSKGSHLVVPKLTSGNALLLTAPSDGRVYFVLPYKGKSIVGTTEVEIEGSPDDAGVDDAERDYLLDALKDAFGDAAPGRADILAEYWGVRALVDGSDGVGSLSREAEVVEEDAGLLAIVGGKYTTYRAVCERCVDRVFEALDRRSPACDTATAPLPGGEEMPMDAYFEIAEDALLESTALESDQLRYLLGTYGSRHLRVLDCIGENWEWRRRLEPGLPFTPGEIVHAVRFEGARTLDDMLWRRTYRAFLGPLDDAARARWQSALDDALG